MLYRDKEEKFNIILRYRFECLPLTLQTKIEKKGAGRRKGTKNGFQTNTKLSASCGVSLGLSVAPNCSKSKLYCLSIFGNDDELVLLLSDQRFFCECVYVCLMIFSRTAWGLDGLLLLL